jgi:hypothetical protein
LDEWEIGGTMRRCGTSGGRYAALASTLLSVLLAVAVNAARDAFARIDNRPGLAMADQARGFHHARQSDPATAAEMFGRAAATFDDLGNGPNAGVNLLWRAEQLRAAGRGAEADADEARGEALLEGSDLPVARMVRDRLREG